MTDTYPSPPFPFPSTLLPQMQMQEYAAAAQRRVKPLPKRRRTSDVDPVELAAYADIAAAADEAGAFATPGPGPDFASAAYYQFPSVVPAADAQSQSSPVRIDGVDPNAHAVGAPPLASSEFHNSNLNATAGATAVYRTGGGGEDEDEHADGDYIDHLQQPGNTKKRKVPAAHHISGGGGAHFDDSSGTIMAASGGDGSADQADEQVVQGFAGGQLGAGLAITMTGTGVANSSLPQNSALHPRKFRASPATLTGLKRKEILKSRKRQVLSIVNSLPNAETLALDQALASRLPWYRPASGIHLRPKHTSRPPRNSSSFSRRHLHSTTTSSSNLPEHVSTPPLWDQQSFTFECPSITTERLLATRSEASNLVEQFQTELDRQATAAALAARQAAAANNEALMKSNSTKSQRMRTSEPSRSRPGDGAATGGGGTESTTGAAPAKSRSKKKKRSALANASNPHHLRNYVPSRLPNSGPPPTISAAQAALTFLGPPPVRFLTADLLPRGGTGVNNTSNTPNRKRLTGNGGAHPAGTASPDDGVVMPDEWICSFCEYDLFYGSEASFRHGVRARKKILRRRRRARERAARAASGVGPAAPSSQMDDAETEDEGEYEGEAPYESAQASGPRTSGGSSQQATAGRMGGDDGAG